MPAQKRGLALSEQSESKGFTLVELLVVVAIIGVLATIGVTVFTGARSSANNAKAKADIDSIRKAYEGKYDPISATYAPLTDSDFSGGAIPTTDGKPLAADKSNSYIVAGSFVTSANPSPAPTINYAVCSDTVTGQRCTNPAGSCSCVQSTQSTSAVDFLTLSSNKVLNPSFEIDLNSDGLADNWLTVPTITTTSLVADAVNGSKAQRVVGGIGAFYQIWNAPAQILQNTNYTVTAWVKLISGGATLSLAGNGFGAICSSPITSTSWTKIQFQCNTGANGTIEVSIRLDTGSTEFYIDSVQLEQI